MNRRKFAAGTLLACLLLAAAVPAAEWKDGRSPAQPYEGVREVDLDKKIGYRMLYPREKMPAEHFCDVLEMYLPREDLKLGEGKIHLYDESGEIFSAAFTDDAFVQLRPLEEQELEGLVWGSGTCVEVNLPFSLSMDKSYYVLMDKGCLTAADGKAISEAIKKKSDWVPVVSGDYGVSNLLYIPEEGPAHVTPQKGDKVQFDLVMGGDTVTAVTYSENGSVDFPVLEFTESCEVTGTVTGDDPQWGIVFLNKDGDVVYLLTQ